MIEELLTELLLDIIGDDEVVVVEDGRPERGGVSFDSVIGGGEKGASVEFVEGWDETGACEELEKRLKVFVCTEGIDEGGRGGRERELCRERGSG